MVLPSLKSMNFSDKLNNEVVSNALGFKLWVKKLAHWVSTQVNSVGMDAKIAEFFKQLREAPEGVNTEDLFC